MKTQILHEDKEIIVCYKPAGLATQTKQIGQQDVESELKNYLKGGNLFVIHRLDQPVEGILVFAKTKQAAAALSSQLGKECMHKCYQAVVYGVPKQKEGTLIDYLHKEPKGNISKVVKEGTKDAKYSELSYQVLDTKQICAKAESDEGVEIESKQNNIKQELSLLTIRLKTGRHHQIRVQFANANHPLLGDGKYADDKAKELSKKLGIRNVALCASSLTFIHPQTKKQMEFETTPKGIAFQMMK